MLSYVISIFRSSGIYSYPAVFFISFIVYTIVELFNALFNLKAPIPSNVVTSWVNTTSSVSLFFPSILNLTLLNGLLSSFILFKFICINLLFLIFKLIAWLSSFVVLFCIELTSAYGVFSLSDILSEPSTTFPSANSTVIVISFSIVWWFISAFVSFTVYTTVPLIGFLPIIIGNVFVVDFIAFAKLPLSPDISYSAPAKLVNIPLL